MEVFRQFNNKEPLDFFIAESDEIKLALEKLTEELPFFMHYLDDLLTTLYFFLPWKYTKYRKIRSKKYQENFNKIKQTFRISFQKIKKIYQNKW